MDRLGGRWQSGTASGEAGRSRRVALTALKRVGRGSGSAAAIPSSYVQPHRDARAARELPNLPLGDALPLMHLYLERGSPRADPAARRWLVRSLSEGMPSLRDVAKSRQVRRGASALACPTRRVSASWLAPSVPESPSRLRASRELSSRQSSSRESALWPPASSCSERRVARAPGARRPGHRLAPERLSPPEPLPRTPDAAGAADCPQPDASRRLGRRRSSTRRRRGGTRADGAPRPDTPRRDRRGSCPRPGIITHSTLARTGRDDPGARSPLRRPAARHHGTRTPGLRRG